MGLVLVTLVTEGQQVFRTLAQRLQSAIGTRRKEMAGLLISVHFGGGDGKFGYELAC